jgi:uncharacterized protein
MVYLYLLGAGIAGGFMAGMFGIGGGIIYVVALPFALLELGVSPEELPHYTIANSLLATIFASLSALYRHYRNNNLFPGQSLILGLAGGFTAILLTKYVVEQAFFSMLVFNWIFLALLIYMLLDLIGRKRKTGQETMEVRWKYIPIGIAGGLVSALSGLGGGIAVVPLVLKFQKFNFKQVTSISMGFIAISSFIVSLYNSGLKNSGNEVPHSLGFLVFPITLSLVVGVIFGAQFGVSTAKKLKAVQLRNGFAVLLILVVFWKLIEVFDLG